MNNEDLALTYHVGVNTVTPWIKGASPVIVSGNNKRMYWIPLPREIDYYTPNDLCYSLDTQEHLCLPQILEIYKNYNVFTIHKGIQEIKIHIDPDFYSGTYGEYWKPYPIIRLLKEKKDFIIFFVGTFKNIQQDKVGDRYWGILGHMLIDHSKSIELYKLDFLDKEDFCRIIIEYKYNAHLTRAFKRKNLNVDEKLSCSEVIKVLGGNAKDYTVLFNELKKYTRILLKAKHYCIYTYPLKIWRPRGDTTYGELFSSNIILKQTLYSRAYVMARARKFIGWLIEKNQ